MLLAAVCLIVTNCNMLKFGMYLSNERNVLSFSDYNFYRVFKVKKIIIIIMIVCLVSNKLL